MSFRHRLAIGLATAPLVAAVAVAGTYAVTTRTGAGAGPAAEPSYAASASATPTAAPVAPVGSAEPVVAPVTPAPTPSQTATPTPAPAPLQPGRTLLGPGADGDDVRDLQARLAQIDWFEGDVTGHYGDVTAEAVRGFQAKRGFPVTGEVDRRTLDRLAEMTVAPTHAEEYNLGNVPGALDARCRTGRVLCIDKTSRTLRWVVDGTVEKTIDVRFGSSSTPTREGAFEVYYKSRYHHSRLYDSDMPYAMFFSGGQAVHYSSDFAARGYDGASHGCVNVRDEDAVSWLFDHVDVGDKVIVYWS